MIEIKNLTKKYPGNKEETLKNITFTFQDTGLYYLLGASGSGKSTLLSLIGGIDYEYEGNIIVNSIALKSLNDIELSNYRLSNIAFAFQDNKSNDKEIVKDSVLKPLRIEKISHDEIEEKLDYYLEKVELKDKKNKKIETLSGGERKRASLVRALIKEAPILLCDEPLSSLNPELREKVTALLVEESKKRLVIIITHEKDEIPDDSSILILENKNLNVLKLNENKNSIVFEEKKRKKYEGLPLLIDILKGIQAKNEFLFITLMSLAISLFAISFSFLLSHGVKTSLTSSLSKYMSDNCMVIEAKEKSFEDENYKTADYSFLSLLKRDYEEVADISTFYLENLDDIFQSDQRMSITKDKRTINLKKLSINSFIEYQTINELKEDEVIYGKREDLSYDEFILGVDDDSIASLYYLLFNKTIPSITDEVISMISEEARDLNLGLRIQCQKSDWKYTLDHSLTMVGIAFTRRCSIIHTSSDFNEHFLKDVMHFNDYFDDEEEIERTPIEIKKCLGVRLFPLKNATFLSKFLFDKNTNKYTLKPLVDETYYLKEDKYTHNRFAVYKDYISKVNPNEILSFVNDNHEKIHSINYSTSVFTYTASGYISGFTKPFFFSKHKEKLNEIQDNYHQTSLNLGQFQGSLIEVSEGVIKADLLSSSQEDGLKYHSLDRTSLSPLIGRKPLTYTEIAISTKLAAYLFESPQYALDQSLEVLMLINTTRIDDSEFENQFDEGQLKITGIYDSDEFIIYQDSLFPLCYAFLNSQLLMNDIRINEAILNVNLTDYDIDYYEKEIKRYGDYKISFPMKSMIDEIQKTMSNLSNLFLTFASLSLVLASTLLSLSLYLILERDKKEIGILLSLGFMKKEIDDYYLNFALTIGFISYLFSILITLLSEQVLKRTLLEMLSTYSFSSIPYLISFGVYFVVTSLIGLILRIKIKNYSPKDAFDK